MRASRLLTVGLLVGTLATLLTGAMPARAFQDAAMAIRDYQFAVYLFDRHEYLRAVTEFERYAFTAGTDDAEVAAAYAIAACYQQAHDWARAKSAWTSLMTRFPQHAVVEEAAYRLGECAAAANDIPAAQSALTAYLTHADAESEFRDDAALLLAIATVSQRDWTTARAQLEEYPGQYPKSALLPTAEVLRKAVDAVGAQPRKSSRVAVALSAVVPGLGQIYAGRSRDGVTALLVNLAFIGLSLDRVHRDDSTGAALTTLTAATFYTGNLYGAAGAAIQHNRAQDTRVLDTTFTEIRQSIGAKLGHQERLRPWPL